MGRGVGVRSADPKRALPGPGCHVAAASSGPTAQQRVCCRALTSPPALAARVSAPPATLPPSLSCAVRWQCAGLQPRPEHRRRLVWRPERTECGGLPRCPSGCQGGVKKCREEPTGSRCLGRRAAAGRGTGGSRAWLPSSLLQSPALAQAAPPAHRVAQATSRMIISVL